MPDAFFQVVAPLEEEDILVPKKEDAALKLKNGATWGVPLNDQPLLRVAEWEIHLGLAPSVIPDLADNAIPARGTLAEKQEWLVRCQEVMNKGSTHSRFSRFAQAVGAYLATDIAEEMGDRSHGQLEDAELDDALPAPPASGYHDSKAYPELDEQPIPTGKDITQPN